MGQPDCLHRQSPAAEYIGGSESTQGSETSQYLQEEKSTEIPLVAASERGKAQTGSVRGSGVAGPQHGIVDGSGKCLESTSEEGERPVHETESDSRGIPSTAGHVESRGNLGGPSSKAKYSLATDSEPVP